MLQLPDPEEVLLRGRAARDFLAHPVFGEVINDLDNFHLTAMVSSPPGPKGQDARDHHHLMHHALAEIVAQLQQYAQAAAEIEQDEDGDEQV